MEDAVKTVKEKAFFMKRALDGDNTKQAIDFAIEMLKELKTNTLNPKNYYELYMKVSYFWNEWNFLYIFDLFVSGCIRLPTR